MRRPSSLSSLLIGLLALTWAVACAARGTGGPSFQQLEDSALFAGNAKILGVLTSGSGNLVLIGGEGDSLAVRYAVSAPTREGLFRNQVETIDKGDSLFVTIRPTSGSRVDLQVEMPEELAVELRDEGRDVIFRNIENRVVVFLHEAGSLDLEDIEGPLSITDGEGPLRIRDVRGPIVILDKGGGVLIRDVKNSVRLETGDGDVTIEQVGADVSLTMGAGRLTLRDIQGKAAYRKAGGGAVTVERVAGGVEQL